ncbi:uncharacterized protein N7458_009202 [Penicillium daleae]|uniref:Uncharacterized protein n=1 Tax=Penicillium daleae TaxID=63821 RepID=A0AAD6BZA9_9EURO|nr:uncharacterized protein N7458_009202 [Penicillium daleae]KAJ5438204.1 hypothetical protein N7458_009202 [Penicillium daleae]
MSYREELQARSRCPIEELCDAIYPATALSAITGDLDFFAERSIITIRNDVVTVFNDQLISRMPGGSRIY